jgi:hypothetical protein
MESDFEKTFILSYQKLFEYINIYCSHKFHLKFKKVCSYYLVHIFIRICFINHECIILLKLNLILIRFFLLKLIFDIFITTNPLVMYFIHFEENEAFISYN